MSRRGAEASRFALAPGRSTHTNPADSAIDVADVVDMLALVGARPELRRDGLGQRTRV